MSYVRPLADNILAKAFVEGVLKFQETKKINAATISIMQAELHLETMNSKPTLRFMEFRSPEYKTDEARGALRRRILNELIQKIRLDNDDKIKLGKGGALPQTEIKKGKKAFFITGLPASGKSGIANKIADAEGAVILDSDYAKRKLPEFAQGQYGASVVHDESAVIVFGDEKDESALNLKGYCLSEDYNVVIPKIGNSEESLLELAAYFKGFGYSVHLTLVSLDRQKATVRAYERFAKSKRYVPLSLIFDVYSNDPTLTYYRLKQRQTQQDVFASFGKVSTDVALGERPRFIEASDGNPASLFSSTP